jgi:elongator complex protein 3
MKDRGVKCSCIRCREAREKQLAINNYELRIIKYQASGGEEYFIQVTDKKTDILFGFCRLRLKSHNSQLATHNLECEIKKIKSPSPPLLKGAGLIRELHVYGELVPVGGRKKVQHAGLGKKLMQEAEKIAQKQGYEKIAVISGVGVRGYYRKLGYKLQDSYMAKNLV